MMKDRLKKILNYLFYLPQWQVGIGHGSFEAIIESGTLPSIKWWPRQRSTLFNADPFPLENNIVYERMNRWRGRAEIWIANQDGTGAKKWLKKPWHLSYPCISIINGKKYRIIESSAASECVIQVFDGAQWIDISRINEPLVDATPFVYNNRHWVFGTLANGDENRALHIWWSHTINGPWIPHKNNPVKIDPSSSRPAGNVCQTSMGLIRPAQDCHVTYGGALAFCRIEKLDEHEYSETVLMRLQPQDPYLSGIHTLNFSDNLFIVDGKMDVFHPLAFILKKISSHGMKYVPRKPEATNRGN